MIKIETKMRQFKFKKLQGAGLQGIYLVSSNK